MVDVRADTNNSHVGFIFFEKIQENGLKCSFMTALSKITAGKTETAFVEMP